MREYIYRNKDLKERGFGDRTTIWRKVKAGKFPEPQIILGRPGWRESVIKEYLENCPSSSHTASEKVEANHV